MEKNLRPFVNERNVTRHKDICGFYVTTVSTENEHEIRICSENTEDGEETGILIDCDNLLDLAATAQKLSSMFANIADKAILQSNIERTLLGNQVALSENYSDTKGVMETYLLLTSQKEG